MSRRAGGVGRRKSVQNARALCPALSIPLLLIPARIPLDPDGIEITQPDMQTSRTSM
jgi:hypothetical protein